MDDLRQSASVLNAQRKQTPAAASNDDRSSSPLSDMSFLPLTESLSLNVTRKRPAEDFSAYSRMVGRARKLRKEDQDELDKFAKVRLNCPSQHAFLHTSPKFSCLLRRSRSG